MPQDTHARMQTWTCQRCGAQCERRPKKGTFPKWCSELCAKRAAHQRERDQLKPIPCGWCGVIFKPGDPGTRGCTVRHGYYLAMHGAPSSSQEVTRWSPTTSEPTYHEMLPFREGPCAWCGTRFTTKFPTVTFCKPTCKTRAAEDRKRRARGKFAITRARRQQLHERDNWTCWLCDRPTSRVYSHDDPDSPTLDHVVPQSLALVPDHSDANLRTAHALCNTIRSNAPAPR